MKKITHSPEKVKATDNNNVSLALHDPNEEAKGTDDNYGEK